MRWFSLRGKERMIVSGEIIKEKFPDAEIIAPKYFERYKRGLFFIKKTIPEYAGAVWDITGETGGDTIIIGYSLGGLIARYMVERMNFPAKAVILVGTPNRGINLFLKEKLLLKIVKIPCIEEMRKGSEFIESFAERKPPPDYYYLGGKYDKRVSLSSSAPLSIYALPRHKRSIIINTGHSGLIPEKFGIDYLKTAPKYKNNFSTYIPIMTGCDNFCSYCVVPYTRGPEISRPPEDILNEARNLIEKGCKEIWLLGQNVNSYKSKIPNPKFQTNPKSQIPINFAELLKIINDIPGNFWIRFTSPHPKDFSDELAETMAKCEKAAPYLNLPIQSGDNEILKKMNRPYTTGHYKNLVEKIKNAFKKQRKGLEKNIFLSTDVIVGFPGETKKQFENTAKIFKEIKFDMAYISQYSHRSGTAAFKLKDDVSHEEKKQREKILTEILKKTALENGRKFKGKEIEVLISKSRIMNYESGILIGKSRHYKTVKIQLNAKRRNLNADLIGKFVKVKIIGIKPFGFEGKILE
ncbi:tRNA A37 methylthiotransferase MiaB [Candidatus Methanophagaceae archaeon]|nr:tRNA A37 methylthiotransferase MiaB [Methanophagales archaeon]